MTKPYSHHALALPRKARQGTQSQSLVSESMHLCSEPGFMAVIESLVHNMSKEFIEEFVQGLENEGVYETIHKNCAENLDLLFEELEESYPEMKPRIHRLRRRLHPETEFEKKMATNPPVGNKVSMKKGGAGGAILTGSLLLEGPNRLSIGRVLEIGVCSALGAGFLGLSIFFIVRYLRDRRERLRDEASQHEGVTTHTHSSQPPPPPYELVPTHARQT